MLCSGGVKLVQFAVPDNYHPVCEYDTVNFMLYATIAERFDGLFHTFILYCDRILAETDLLSRSRYFHVHPCINQSGCAVVQNQRSWAQGRFQGGRGPPVKFVPPVPPKKRSR